MSTIQITVAMALIPIGFVFLVWGVNRGSAFIYIIAISIIILGMCSWYASLKSIIKEEKRNRKERKAFLKVIKSIDRQIRELNINLKPEDKQDGK